MPRLLPVRRHDAGTEGIAQSATRGRPAAEQAVHRAPIPPAAQAVHRTPVPPAAQAAHRTPLPTTLLRRMNQNLNLLLLFHQRVKTFLNQIRQINPLGHQLIGLEITLSH